MKKIEEIIVRLKRDLYEYFDARIKRIEDKMEEMRAIEDKTKSVKEIRKELLASKEGLKRILARLDIEEEKEEEGPVILQLAWYNKTVQQNELFDVAEGSMRVKELDVGFYWGVATRVEGPLAGKAFLLNDRYDWELGRDKDSRLCLVPIKKRKNG